MMVLPNECSCCCKEIKPTIERDPLCRNCLGAGFFYVIKAANYIKVGRSEKPHRRLDQFEIASPHDCHFIFRRAFKNSSLACWAEGKIKHILSAYRVKGEWFKLTKPSRALLMNFIAELDARRWSEKSLNEYLDWKVTHKEMYAERKAARIALKAKQLAMVAAGQVTNTITTQAQP